MFNCTSTTYTCYSSTTERTKFTMKHQVKKMEELLGVINMPASHIGVPVFNPWLQFLLMQTLGGSK